MWVVARAGLDASGASWIRRQKLFSAMSECGGSGTVLMTPGCVLSLHAGSLAQPHGTLAVQAAAPLLSIFLGQGHIYTHGPFATVGDDCEELWSQAWWYTTVILVLGAKAGRWREFKVNLGYLEKGRKSTLLSSQPQDSTSPVMNRRNSDLPEQPHPSLLFRTKINEGSRVWGCSSVARMSPWHYKVP